jgi:polyhydroxyalkanoate synthesis regulator phasin
MPKVPQGPDWKQILEAGMQFTEMRRSQARSLAADLVAHGHLARDQMATTVDEFVELSRRRTADLRKIVQAEVARQLGTVGIATKKDLAALERRLTKASREAKKAPAKKKATKKPATGKKATRKAG